jgi:hypothetical protein
LPLPKKTPIIFVLPLILVSIPPKEIFPLIFYENIP